MSNVVICESGVISLFLRSCGFAGFGVGYTPFLVCIIGAILPFFLSVFMRMGFGACVFGEGKFF